MKSVLAATAITLCLAGNAFAAPLSAIDNLSGDASTGLGDFDLIFGSFTNFPAIALSGGSLDGLEIDFGFDIAAPDLGALVVYTSPNTFLDVIGLGFVSGQMQFQLDAGAGFGGGSVLTLSSVEFADDNPFAGLIEGDYFQDVSVSIQGISAVPLPAGGLLLLTALGGLGLARQGILSARIGQA